MNREIHSADGTCWIDGEAGAWRVVWKGYVQNAVPIKTREKARTLIRSLKRKGLHEEHVRRARAWWNGRNYFAKTPEAPIEEIAVLLDEAYDTGREQRT